MPMYEYECSKHGLFEVFYKSFKEAEPREDSAPCPECVHYLNTPGQFVVHSPRVVEQPLEAHLYGRPDGYNKPSPAKRHSYKKINWDGN